MARDKVTITADRHKLATARTVTGARSTSEAIDIALDRLLASERNRRDVEAYLAQPTSSEESALASASPTWAGLADETDWDALYRDEPS